MHPDVPLPSPLSPRVPARRLASVLLAAAWAVLAGCTGESEQIIKPEPPRPEDEKVAVELIHMAAQDLGGWERLTPSLPAASVPTTLSVAQGRALVGTAVGLWASHPDLTDQVVPLPLRHADGEPESTGAIGSFARRANGGVLMAAQTGLFHDLDGALYLSPLSNALPGPVAQVSSHGEGNAEELWLLPTSAEPGRLWVVTSEGLHDLKLSVESAPDAVVALGEGRGLVSAGGTLFAVDVAARTAKVVLEAFGPVHSVDRSAAGFLFFGTDRGLVVRDAEGNWARHTLVPTERDTPPAVRSVFAGIGAQVFLSTDSEVLQLGGNGLTKLADRSGPSPSVARDASGDTWIVDEGRAVRLLTGAPVSFAQHVQPFLGQHCAGCHEHGNGAPIIDFENYEVAKEKADRIVIRLEADGATPMPPQSVEILTRQQYAVVLRWVAGGMKP